MPSLNVALLSLIIFNVSSPARASALRIWGMVGSPTPIVPICSDSISLISTLLSHCERTAAVIQPAVPPPTIVTLRTGESARATIPSAKTAYGTAYTKRRVSAQGPPRVPWPSVLCARLSNDDPALEKVNLAARRCSSCLLHWRQGLQSRSTIEIGRTRESLVVNQPLERPPPRRGNVACRVQRRRRSPRRRWRTRRPARTDNRRLCRRPARQRPA